MELTKLRIADLEEHEENYNTHPPEQVVQLEGSLEMFEEYFEGGQYKNVVVCQGKVLAGNGLVMAARNRGEEYIDAQVNDNLPDDIQRALIVADNATPAGALPDAAKLKSIFDQLDPFSIPGVTQEWIDSCKVDWPVQGEGMTDADEIPEIEEDSAPITQPGDLWQLGKHRLLCGDCTKPDDVKRLMQDEKAELLFTSPPYADMRTYDGNDLAVDTLVKFIPAFYPYAAYQVINLGIKRENHEIVEYWQEYITEAKQAGYKLISWNIWDKYNAGNISPSMFPVEHEWIFVFGHKNKDINRTIPISENTILRRNQYSFNENGDAIGTRRDVDGSIKKHTIGRMESNKKIGTVLRCFAEMARNNTKSHPAVFPIGLPSEYVKAMTNEQDIVVDPFGGSGTTMIACEALGRQCRMMEISPKYVDVCVRRWELYSGQEAQRI